MVAKNKMRCLLEGFMFLLTFNIIFCSPTCPSCSGRKRPERHTSIGNEFLTSEFKSSTDVNLNLEWNLSQDDGTKNTIERPEYTDNVEPVPRLDVPLELKTTNVPKDVQANDQSIRVHCPLCRNGLLRIGNSHKHVGCVCALFTTNNPFPHDTPLFSRTFQNVSCPHSVSEEDACTRTCLSLALAYYKVKDVMICSRVKNATNLKAILYTKVCGINNNWTFTGLTTNKPICCNMDKPVRCENAEAEYGQI